MMEEFTYVFTIILVIRSLKRILDIAFPFARSLEDSKEGYVDYFEVHEDTILGLDILYQDVDPTVGAKSTNDSQKSSLYAEGIGNALKTLADKDLLELILNDETVRSGFQLAVLLCRS